MTRKRKPEAQQPEAAPKASPPVHGTAPDLFLIMKRKDGGGGIRVGAAWTNAKGGISLKLNNGVVLSWRDCNDCWLTLWPNDDVNRDFPHNTADRNHDEVPF